MGAVGAVGAMGGTHLVLMPFVRDPLVLLLFLCRCPHFRPKVLDRPAPVVVILDLPVSVENEGSMGEGDDAP